MTKVKLKRPLMDHPVREQRLLNACDDLGGYEPVDDRERSTLKSMKDDDLVYEAVGGWYCTEYGRRHINGDTAREADSAAARRRNASKEGAP